MDDIAVILLQCLWLVSMVCCAFLVVTLYITRRNPIIIIYAIAYLVMGTDVLASIAYKNELQNAPKLFCFMQGIIMQFCVYVEEISAFCFAIFTYNLLAKCKQESYRVPRTYLTAIAIYPVVMVSILIPLAIKYDAIKPRRFNCDVLSPAWVRLVGWSGSNFFITVPGTYLSARAVQAVLSHLNDFKSCSSFFDGHDSNEIGQTVPAALEDPLPHPKSPSSHENNACEEKTTRITLTSTNNEKLSDGNPESSSESLKSSINSPLPYSEPHHRSTSSLSITLSSLPPAHHLKSTTHESPLPTPTPYDTTLTNHSSTARFNRPFLIRSEHQQIYSIHRTAAIKMILFFLSYSLLNIIASIQTFISVFNNRELERNISMVDWCGGVLGILLWLVFGTGKHWKRRQV